MSSDNVVSFTERRRKALAVDTLQLELDRVNSLSISTLKLCLTEMYNFNELKDIDGFSHLIRGFDLSTFMIRPQGYRIIMFKSHYAELLSFAANRVNEVYAHVSVTFTDGPLSKVTESIALDKMRAAYGDFLENCKYVLDNANALGFFGELLTWAHQRDYVGLVLSANNDSGEFQAIIGNEKVQLDLYLQLDRLKAAEDFLL